MMHGEAVAAVSDLARTSPCQLAVIIRKRAAGGLDPLWLLANWGCRDVRPLAAFAASRISDLARRAQRRLLP